LRLAFLEYSTEFFFEVAYWSCDPYLLILKVSPMSNFILQIGFHSSLDMFYPVVTCNYMSFSHFLPLGGDNNFSIREKMGKLIFADLHIYRALGQYIDF